MDPKLAFVDRLLQLERRISRIYRKWAANEIFPAGLRSFWEGMADDEQQHLKILERSAGLLNFASAPPPITTVQMKKVEAPIAAAELLCDTSDLDIERALGHALALESSELNQLDDAWLTSFQPGAEKIMHAGIHTHTEHLRRLYQATCRFTDNESLHKEAAALLSQYELETAAYGR